MICHSNCSLFQWEQFVLDELYGTFSIDAFVTSHPIYVPVKTVAEMESVFDTISYSKVSDEGQGYLTLRLKCKLYMLMYLYIFLSYRVAASSE